MYRDILRHAQRLANPVWYRYSRQSLLRLRQRYPEKFQVEIYRIFRNISIWFKKIRYILYTYYFLQDTCLFSDVAARLSSGTYRMPARRFLQELFLDSPFEAVSSDTLFHHQFPSDRTVFVMSAVASALFYRWRNLCNRWKKCWKKNLGKS